MSSFLRDLPGSLTNRPSPLAFAGLYAIFLATLIGWTAFVAGRWGSPLRWPGIHRVAVALLGFGGSVAWCLVNGSVEGRAIVTLSHDHAITSADLLIVPTLAFAAGLAVVEAAPRLRRTRAI